MSDLIRILNEEGIGRFRDHLANLREGSSHDAPHEFLDDPWLSSKLPGAPEVERLSFKTSLDLAKYLYSTLSPIRHSRIDQNIGLWSWLSLYYFDQLCPLRRNGLRRPGVDYRLILDTDARVYHRHLLFGPYMVFRIHGEKAALLLSSPVHQTNKFRVELASRQGFITNKGVIEAAGLLYFNKDRGKAKPGAAVTTRNPGTLLRFIDVVQQLDLTYDLHSMSGEQVLRLLPAEFDEWK